MKRLKLGLPDFAQIPVTRADILHYAMACVGLPYSDQGTYIEWDGDDATGQCNCDGLLFAVAERAGLIDGLAFRKAFNRAVAKHGKALTLRAYLGAQLWREPKTAHQRGDILLFRWNEPGLVFEDEEDAIRRARHHVAISAGDGWVIHALDTKADLSGRVILSQLNQHDWQQLHQVWSLPQYALERNAQKENNG